jgi:hypothetical protein
MVWEVCLSLILIIFHIERKLPMRSDIAILPNMTRGARPRTEIELVFLARKTMAKGQKFVRKSLKTPVIFLDNQPKMLKVTPEFQNKR